MSAASRGIYDCPVDYSLIPSNWPGFEHGAMEGQQLSASTVSQIVPMYSTQFYLAAELDSSLTIPRVSGNIAPLGDPGLARQYLQSVRLRFTFWVCLLPFGWSYYRGRAYNRYHHSQKT